MKLTLYVSLLLFFYCSFIYAQQPIIITDSLKSANICSKTSFYEDKSNKMSFEEIEKKTFQNFQNNEYNFRFSPSTFWIKFTLDSKLQSDYTYIIQFTNWYIDVADLYNKSKEGDVTILKGGDFEEFSKKTIKSKYPTFSIVVKANDKQTYFVKIENSQYNNFKINLVENLHYLQYKEFGDSRELILGLVMMRFAFHISLLFYMFQNKIFRAYSYWGVLLCFVYYLSGGYASFVFTTSPYLANLAFYFSLSFVPGVMSFYIYRVFDLSNRLPKISWLFIGFGAIGALNLILNVFIHHAILSHVFIGFMAFFITFQLCFSIWFYIKIYKPSFWYIFPLIFYLPAFSVYYMQNAGFYHFATNFNIVQFTFFVDFISIPFITGALLKISKLENLKLEESYFKEKIETEKLQELDTLKTQFFTNISHEFRTPLTLILGPIDDLLIKYPKEALFHSMKRNAQRLLTLINQLLDLSKLDVGQMNIEIQRDDLAKFIQILTSSFGSLAENRNIDFRVRQNRKEAIAYFDADKIEKIITNLLSNAFKFTQDGGKIDIEVNYDDNFNEVEIAVKDNGIGITAQKTSRIFDRFYQIDGSHQRNYEGSGIGLALVKEMINLHKGVISVESEEGKGASFFVKLPINKATWDKENVLLHPNKIPSVLDLPLKTQDLPSVPSTKALTENIILIVEDNPDLRLYIRNIFEHDYQIIEAIDGQDGIEKAMAHIPDIVICDLMMPRLDGFGLCKILKTDEKTNHIPVIMLTAKATQQDKNEGLNLGADDYLAKPFNTDELKIRVANLIKQRELLKEKYSQITLTEAVPTEGKPLSMDELFIQKAYQVIEQHLSDSGFEVEQFCEALAMSRTTMHRKLKALTNQSTTEFIRNYRLEKARYFLKNKTGNVSDIAYQVGFESLPYFSKTFQERFGILPSELK
jgi:signal transduction histidine kinase/DNA-binding response OmpR family regulator